MLKAFPKNLFGKALCLATLCTTFFALVAEGSATRQEALKADLDEIRSTLNISSNDDFQDKTNPDPEFRKYLNFMGSWFMGDQIGEKPVIEGSKVTKFEIVNQLYAILPILKANEEVNKASPSDLNLSRQSISIENAIGIYEIIQKLADTSVTETTKTQVIEDLNTKIFAAVDGGETVLIPVMWKGFVPGSLLISLKSVPGQSGLYLLRVFDTNYRFFDNQITSDNGNRQYPAMISPWKQFDFINPEIKKNKILIIGLTILNDDGQMKEYNKAAFGTDVLDSTIKEIGLKYKDYNAGLVYFTKVYLRSLKVNIDNYIDSNVKWPLVRFHLGPVGNIQAYLSSTASNFQNYPTWKLGMDYTIVKHFIKRYGSDADVHFESRSSIVLPEIVGRSANRLLKDAFEMVRVEGIIPSQVGEGKNEFKVLKDEIEMNSSDNQKRLKLIVAVMKLRDEVLSWLKEKGFDSHKLKNINRSLGQREMGLKRRQVFSIASTLDIPEDLTHYLSLGGKATDYKNCMTGIGVQIRTIDEFIRVFSPMVKRWKWFSFSYDVESSHCKPFFRRNSELILRNMFLGELDDAGLAAWAPKSQRQYKKFLNVVNAILAPIIVLTNGERTMEDYIIIMRVQRVVWKVAQSLDNKFASQEPARHLDLTKYSLSFPQCHKVLAEEMNTGNIFLADSGAFGNILNIESVAELKDLCKELVDEEKSGKPVLNFDKYCAFLPIIFDRLGYTRINSGDREIYMKMSQHPIISRTVRENLNKYNYNWDSATENGAHAASLGQVGSQFIFYQFFDALKIIFLGNVAVTSRVSADATIKLTYLPIKTIESTIGSVLMMLPLDTKISESLPTVNEELIKKNSKSYIKASIIESFSSNFLGLDVIMNHMARGSSKFWSSNSIFEEVVEPKGFIKFIINLIEKIKNTFETFRMMFEGGTVENIIQDFKVVRRDVAGTADFYLNCSAHLLRKLDVAPGYEELVMTMIMKTMGSVDKELMELLKILEVQEGSGSEFIQDIKKIDTESNNYRSGADKHTEDTAENIKRNEEFLKNEKENPNEKLKSLINWAVIAIRFAKRVRTLKPEWKNRYSQLPKQLYSTMIKYSRAKDANNRRLSILNKELVAHVDYFLFMNCEMHLNDHNLRLEVYENLKPASDVDFPQDSVVLPAAMVLHRMLALSNYEFNKDGPLTEEFISNQYGIIKVITAISHFKEENESFLVLMAQFISPYLRLTPKEVISAYKQGGNVEKGNLIYDRFSINLVQGTFTEKGLKARDPNTILRYAHFKQFFSSGNEQVTPLLGRPALNCESRYEIVDFLQVGTKYSICEYPETKSVAIYRHIPKFMKPCLLLKQKRVIESLQRSFSVYSTEGVDIFQCRRGNHVHFVWIRRDEIKPSYISHGRLWQPWDFVTETHYAVKIAQHGLKSQDAKYLAEFEFELSKKLPDVEPNIIDRFLTPVLIFPRLEIVEFDERPVYPLTAESKLLVVPEPIIRFASRNHFGSYILDNKLIFMFQKFRFQDRPEVSFTFIEDKDGNLEMKGRDDLKVCEDQIFENNFQPALMLRKTDDPKADIRLAFVPMTNPELEDDLTSDISDEIKLSYNLEDASSLSTDLKDGLIFMEAMAVEKYPVKEFKGETTTTIFGYKLKPISRLQRILLAFHNLRLRNYEESLKYLNPRTEIDHNTELREEEKKILDWMVNLKSAQEPEAVALKLMAKIHLILDKELFPPLYNPKNLKITTLNSNGAASEDVVDDNSMIRSYARIYTSLENDYSDVVPDVNSFDEDGEQSSNLGIYFAFLPLLSKRFHIDQVFREAMGSRHVQNFLNFEYNDFKVAKTKESALLDDQNMIQNLAQETICRASPYFKNQILTEIALKVPSSSAEKALDSAITKRYLLKYAKEDCQLRESIFHSLIHIHDRKENIPDDLHELIVIYLNLSGIKRNDVDLHIMALSDSSRIQQLRRLINVEDFKYEHGMDRDEYGHMVPRLKPKLEAFKNYVHSNARQNEYSTANVGHGNAILNRTPASDIVDPILPDEKPSETGEGDINTIKFVSEDFNFVSIKDRELYTKIIEMIRDARLEKAEDEKSKLKLADLLVKSKTQEALKQAISDYMKERKEPVDFDKLAENPFVDLKTHIVEKIIVLNKNLKKLELSYAKYFIQMREKKKLLPLSILGNLKRIFNETKVPVLKDLRDCFMQMSRTCLSDRLPEFSKGMIENISQVLKRYYIQTIILNNLKAISAKIEEFDDLSGKAGKAMKNLSKKQSESSATIGPNDIQTLKDEIFDHKDTALLFVEDIYNDMEKLLLLEQRLQDPVTLNFEFMSSKFHLTNVQVQDIANLATRSWEDEFRKDVMQKFDEMIAEHGEIKSIETENMTEVDRAINKLVKFVKRFNIELNTSEGIDRSRQRSPEQRAIDAANRKTEIINKDYIVKPEDMWAYLPRNERIITDADKDDLEAYYNKRPILKTIEKVGKLLPYNSELDSYFSRVIQRKMAAGKTTVLGTAATVKKADGRTLSVLVLLSSLYQSSAPDMQKRTSDFFNTRGFAFAMPKPRLTIPQPGDKNHPARNFLLWTLKTLVNTINSNSYLVVTPETLQSFLNSYVEFLDAFISQPGGQKNEILSNCLHLFATIYGIFRSRGSIILDEIDSSMRPQKELNFPTTKRETILVTGVELTSDLLLHSAFDESILKAGLNLLANQQAALNDDQYKQVRKLWRAYVKTQLDDKSSIWYRVFFPKNQDSKLFNVDRLLKFFFDPSVLDVTKPPEEGEEDYEAFNEEIAWMANVRKEAEKTFHAMMVFKMQMKNWMRNCFKGAVNEHYGPAINKPGKKEIHFAIPYMAANTPAEDSIFADRWETVNKTLMMYLVKNLSLNDLSMILLDLRSISQSSSQGDLDVKAEFHAACPEFDLLNLKFNSRNKLVDADGKISKCMKSQSKHSLKLIFHWVFKMVFETNQFFAEQITSNAINLTTMFPSVQGYSGTIDNVNILPHQVMIEAEKDHRINEQANGAITMKLLQQDNCVTTVQKIENIKTLEALMDSMCRDFKDLSTFSAFIDVGALLKDFSNANVALVLAKKFKRKTVLYYDERSNQLSFLEYDPKTGTEHRAVLEGSETKYLNSATNSLVKDRFTYYDQRHITGSDILQPPTAKAFLTIGPKVLLRDILQGVMRMRQFQSGQSIHFITTSAVETLLSKFSNTVSAENDKGLPRVKQNHLIALGALNEDEKQLAENLRLYRVKIDAELRAFVMDRLTEALAEKDPYNERVTSYLRSSRGPLVFGKNHQDLFLATRQLFIRNVQENPINWATINVQKNTEEAVREYYEERIKIIPDMWKEATYEDLWRKTDDNLQALIEKLPEDKDDPEYINYARSVLNYLGETIETTTIPTAFKTPTSETVDQGSTVEMELQLELQQELEIELEQNILYNTSENSLPEPELKFEFGNEEDLESLIMGPVRSRAARANVKTSETQILDGIDGLFTPWRLYETFGSGGSGNFKDALEKIYRADVFCPGLSEDESILEYCRESRGFVGMSRGIAKVTTSNEIDFVTMAAREGTHLLFWRGRVDSDSEYKHAVFLISGSEAISLHKTWKYKSSSIQANDAFWLTDLYGFEIHGSPFAVTSYSSNKFSLLEDDYEEYFADLHFRALVLNGSYSVILSSSDLYVRMRAWIGDPAAIAKISNEDDLNEIQIPTTNEASGRVKYFLSRLTWLSKLRNELVSSDPLLQLMLRISAKIPVDFEKSDGVFEEHLDRGNTLTYSDSVASESSADLENDSKSKPWKAASNINSSSPLSVFTWTMIIVVLTTLALIGYIWGKSAGIEWKELFESKWTLILAFIKNLRQQEKGQEQEQVNTEDDSTNDASTQEEPVKDDSATNDSNNDSNNDSKNDSNNDSNNE